MTTPIRQAKNILCVFAPFHAYPRWETWIAGRPLQAADLKSLSKLRKALILPSYAQLVRSNPRPLAYRVERVADFLRRNDIHTGIDLLASEPDARSIALQKAFPIRDAWTVPGELTSLSRRLAREIAARGYDTVLLAYPDAIGYGWGPIERRLRVSGIPQPMVITGRRREFPLTAYFRRKLRLRRWIQASWLIEIALMSLVLPAGLLLGAWDLLRGAKAIQTHD